MSALLAAKSAPKTAAAAEALRAKHPDHDEPELPTDPPQPVEISTALVRKGLFSFPAGSAAGPSGLTAEVLRLCASAGGPAFLEALRASTVAIANGRVPEAIRPYLFGARLVALEKVGGDLRPIACGEILRRLGAKCLGRVVVKDVVGALVAVGQLGVGQRLGLEAAILAARLFAQDASQQPTQAFLIKLDFQNAFSRLSFISLSLSTRKEIWEGREESLPATESVFPTPKHHIFFGGYGCLKSSSPYGVLNQRKGKTNRK